MDADLGALGAATQVAVDDLLKAYPERGPYRPRTVIGTKIADAEVMTLALTQALLGFTSEARWLSRAKEHYQ